MLKRLRNLWILSGLHLTLSEDKKELLMDYRPVKMKKRYDEATIIDLEDPLDSVEL